MRRCALVALLPISLTIAVAPARAQDALTADQRRTDLMELASTLAKNYAPYEWKRDVVGFDLYRLSPWLQRIHHAGDLEFQETLMDYLASLDDTHVSISFTSPFTARLGFTLDVYDGKVLISSIDRSLLPLAQYPFGVGDELVTLDGEPVERLITSYGKYGWGGNPRSRDRVAAGRIAARSQPTMPHASQADDSALAAIRVAATGAVITCVIPWTTTGIAIDSQGPVPSPRRGGGRLSQTSDHETPGGALPGGTRARHRRLDSDTVNDALPAYMEPLEPLLTAYAPEPDTGVLGLGGRAPTFAPPAGFVQRLGTRSSHFFFSGVYASSGIRIGFLRIPHFAPASTAATLRELDQEISFLNANTDVLVVDVMRNTGGNLLVGEMFAQRLFPASFRTMGYEIRATAAYVSFFASSLTSALRAGARADVIMNLRNNFAEVLSAYNEERGRSAPVPLNAFGSFDLPPAPVPYTKPLLLLTDEFTTSTGDMFAALIQDNHRGPLLGIRTAGAGGSNRFFDCTAYTEGVCSLTQALMNRGRVVAAPGYPPTPYIENVGVHPDIVVDVITRANLMTGGAPFVEAFTAAAVTLAQTAR